MIHIFCNNIEKCFQSQSLEYYLNFLPQYLQEYVLKYVKHEDRLRVLSGKLLLQQALKKIEQGHLFHSIQLDAYKRPYISNAIDFNISHSGKYVVCALTCETGKKIGIDIEMRRRVKYDEFERVYTEKELNAIKESSNPQDAFFEFWTMKEAVMKADGRGFHLSPKSFTIVNNSTFIEDKIWYLKRIFLAETYDCHLASQIQQEELIVQEIIF